MSAPRVPANRSDAVLAAVLAAEEEFVAVRQKGLDDKVSVSELRVGLALSGGGIRSATFSLGILQALSRYGLLQKFDYLSTVSGGSYIGSFFGALYVPPESRGGDPLTPAEETTFVEQPLQSERGQAAIANLREFGRYLTPGGASDTMYGVATIGRNWVMLQCVLGLLPLLMFLTIRLLQSPDAVRASLGQIGEFIGVHIPNALGTSGFRQTTAYKLLTILSRQEFSGLFSLLTLVSGLVVLGAGMAYWYSRRESVPTNVFVRLITDGPLIAAIFVTAGLIYSLGATTTSALTTQLLSISCVVSGDPKSCPEHAPYPTLILIIILGSSIVFYVSALLAARGGQKTSTLTAAVEEENVRSILTRTQANLLLVTLALGAATLIDYLGGQLSDATLHISDHSKTVVDSLSKARTFHGLRLFWQYFWPFAVMAAPALLTVWAHGSLRRGAGPGWLTKPSGQGALGVSIVFFWLVIWAAVARSLSSPDANVVLYAWLLTVLAVLLVALNYGFLNQSSLVSLYSTRLKRAYVGASNPVPGDHGFDIGREGDSIPMSDYYGEAQSGSLARHRPIHLINVTIAQTQPDGNSHVIAYDRKGKPMHVSPAGLVFESGGSGNSATMAFLDCEQLNLSTWTAISGAAASTAIGAMTSLGLSILAMMANVRLGYWWKSNTRRWFLPVSLRDTVHGYLAAELESNFTTDPNRQRWYLTDGGHFENTGAYALIQRRLELIVVCDNGADPDYRLDDVVRLIERARSDLNAEISFLDADGLDQKLGKAGLPRAHFGAYDQLASRPADDEAERKGKAMPYAALARIEYDIDKRGLKQGANDTAPRIGWLLLIKPRLNFAEPPELLAYRKRAGGSDFPQQTTLDQFFDEEQWEAYRRFGEIVGERLFAEGLDPWTPSQALKQTQPPAPPKPKGKAGA